MMNHNGIRMDQIDERNFKEKVAHSIIKRQNVNYISQAELDRQKEEEERKRAAEAAKRLAAEDAAAEAALQDTIEEAKRQKEREAYYNPATNSYSGEYGREEVKDEVAKEQIDKILSEKSEELLRTIEEQTGDE